MFHRSTGYHKTVFGSVTEMIALSIGRFRPMSRVFAHIVITLLENRKLQISDEFFYYCTPPLPPEGTAPEGTRRAPLAQNSRYYECAPEGTAP